ncbi:hypothetical protein [Candidatus Xianfuyuplasma coldseepsis]|uniref:Uncharacterized protein n=1 Tax=Candidatus Xianfuyuplasma coldseepsis TaxID=2782163 RepID=A0A7L7KP35_9MOLU|nr:hypothetical protein [Xianfuyuplasma coldseepsis]QMS84295.1 hypothetical protein G4Z02_00580 [Xianfuyuplasma coldseepsis]
MKLIESMIYAGITFIGLYVLIAVAMRVFEWTNTFYAHVTGGIVATVVAVVVFILLLIRKPSES